MPKGARGLGRQAEYSGPSSPYQCKPRASSGVWRDQRSCESAARTGDGRLEKWQRWL